ncbi:MAG: hypothetical protein ABL897_03645, partial [Hyphomicrobium sp.]
LERGGVVIVNPLPVSDARWSELNVEHDAALPLPGILPPIAPTGRRMAVSIDRQFSEIQFLHPQGLGKYSFRFRPLSAANVNTPELETRWLSIGGVDGETRLGEEMLHGFTGMPTSGFHAIQIVKPQTSERAARVLAALREGAEVKPLECETRTAVSVCTYAEAEWPAIEDAWRKQTAALEKEYRRMDALDACYRAAESAGKRQGTCDLVSPESEEATYEFREGPEK